MNTKQAIKFWNSICMGEVIGHTATTELEQGFAIERPTYTSSICSHLDLKKLINPYMSYCGGLESGMVHSNSNDIDSVVLFLRNLADSIEESKQKEIDYQDLDCPF